MSRGIRGGALALAVVALAVSPACTGQEPIAVTVGDTSTESGTEGATSTSQGSTSGSGGSTSGESTGTSTTAASTGESTTGADQRDFDAACVAVCEKYAECWKPNPFPDFESCLWSCARDYSPEARGCVDATVAANLCRTGLSCAALSTFPIAGCEAEDAAKAAACPTAECQVSFAAGGPTSCSIGQVCSGEASEVFSCKGAECSCLVDDAPTGSCPSMSVCQGGYAEWAAAAKACCGFEI